MSTAQGIFVPAINSVPYEYTAVNTRTLTKCHQTTQTITAPPGGNVEICSVTDSPGFSTALALGIIICILFLVGFCFGVGLWTQECRRIMRRNAARTRELELESLTGSTVPLRSSTGGQNASD